MQSVGVKENISNMEITVIGLGLVGTVAAANLARTGHNVIGIDIDPGRVDQLRSGAVPYYEPGLEQLVQAGIGAGRLRFHHTNAFEGPVGSVALITVGTPQATDGHADMTQVESAVSWVKSRRRSGTVVVMKSTVPPGIGQRIVHQVLAGTGMPYVANPEFLREGRAVLDWQNPDRIVIGADAIDDGALATVEAMHQGIDSPFLITDITSAEMIKYASNAFLATRVSFINEIALLCERVGASIHDVSDGLALDPRTGGKMYAGLGYGGSCFPKDVRALDRIGLDIGVNLALLRAVISVNNRQRLHPMYALREEFGDLTGVRVAVLGLAFKPGTDDVREAPAVDLINALAAEEAIIIAYDPQATRNAQKELPCSVRFAGTAEEATAHAQAVVLATEWEECVEADWCEISRQMRPPRLVFDGRNALDAVRMESLGFRYVRIGQSVS